MLDFVTDPLMKSALLVAAVFLLVAVGIYAVRIWRGSDGKDQLSASDLLTKFREMYAKGNLSEKEFRTIKTKLTPQIESELKDNDETG